MLNLTTLADDRDNDMVTIQDHAYKALGAGLQSIRLLCIAHNTPSRQTFVHDLYPLYKAYTKGETETIPVYTALCV